MADVRWVYADGQSLAVAEPFDLELEVGTDGAVRFADDGSLTRSDYVRFSGDVVWTARSWVRSLVDSLSVYGTVRAMPEIGTLAATSWYPVLAQNGPGSWLQVENEPHVTPANPNTPRGARGSSKGRRTAARSASWTTGWVPREHVTMDGDLAELPVVAVVTPTATSETTVATARLRLRGNVSELPVREGPQVRYERATTLRDSQVWYEIVEQAREARTWWRIAYGPGQTGWVNGHFVETRGELTAVPFVDWNTLPLPDTGSPTQTVAGSLQAYGEYQNLIDNLEGTWEVHRLGRQVTAAFRCERSQVANQARRGEVLCVLPAGFRPLTRQQFTVGDARYVDRAGAYTTNTAFHRFDLAVEPDGRVQYVNNGRIAGADYLEYTADLGWISAESAADPGAEPDGGARVRVYAGPGTDFGRLGSIAGSDDDEYEITGKETESNNWWQIDYEGDPGWVATGDLLATGALERVPVNWAENTYINQMNNLGGRYELQRLEDEVTGFCTSTASPVQYYANENRTHLFLVPPEFRPQSAQPLQVRNARRVDADGNPDPLDPHNQRPVNFGLTVATNGEVRYDYDAALMRDGVGHPGLPPGIQLERGGKGAGAGGAAAPGGGRGGIQPRGTGLAATLPRWQL